MPISWKRKKAHACLCEEQDLVLRTSMLVIVFTYKLGQISLSQTQKMHKILCVWERLVFANNNKKRAVKIEDFKCPLLQGRTP